MIDPDGGLAGGGGPSFWTRLKAFVTGGTISNSGRFVFNTGQRVAGRALATQALKTAGTLAYANAGRLNNSNDGLPSYQSSVSNQQGPVDPYEFYFYNERNEEHAYAFMLQTQQKEGVELAAYLVNNPNTNQQGVLILPWFSNEVNSSVFTHGLDQSGPNGTPTGYITDRNDNVYQTLGYVHTHTQSTIPSDADIRIDNYLQIPTFIIDPASFIEVNTKLPQTGQKTLGNTIDLTTGQKSLFNFIK